MQKLIKYVADDGKEFDKEENCIEYELRLALDNLALKVTRGFGLTTKSMVMIIQDERHFVEFERLVKQYREHLITQAILKRAEHLLG